MTGVHHSSSDDYVTRLDDYATVGGMTPAPSSTGMIINPRTEIVSTHGSPLQKNLFVQIELYLPAQII